MAIRFEQEALVREEANAELISNLGVRERANSSAWEFEVQNDPEHGRWEAILNEDAIAELPYRFVGGRVVLVSTWVSEPYRSQGIATELIARVLDEVRSSGKKITIICPVVGEFIARNRQYESLVDERHPGEGAFVLRTPQPGDWEEQLTEFELDLG